MKALTFKTCILALLVLSAGPGCIAQAAKHGPSKRGAYATGHYRNLLLEAGHSEKEVDAPLQSTFAQLFHGDPSTQAIYYPAGSNADGPPANITDVAHHDARSEGMSYGIMIAVQTSNKAEFDALWDWATPTC